MIRFVKTLLTTFVVFFSAINNPAHGEVASSRDVWDAFTQDRMRDLVSELQGTPGEWRDLQGAPYFSFVTDGLLYEIKLTRPLPAETYCYAGYCSRSGGYLEMTISYVSPVSWQSFSDWNRDHPFASLYNETRGAVLTRVLIADYGIAKGNVAASLTRFATIAKRLSTYR
jgi:hypothetical protein